MKLQTWLENATADVIFLNNDGFGYASALLLKDTSIEVPEESIKEVLAKVEEVGGLVITFDDLSDYKEGLTSLGSGDWNWNYTNVEEGYFHNLQAGLSITIEDLSSYIVASSYPAELPDDVRSWLKKTFFGYPINILWDPSLENALRTVVLEDTNREEINWQFLPAELEQSLTTALVDLDYTDPSTEELGAIITNIDLLPDWSEIGTMVDDLKHWNITDLNGYPMFIHKTKKGVHILPYQTFDPATQEFVYNNEVKGA